MSQLLREGSDYSTNKAPRLPICICIDTSSAVHRSTIPDINYFLEMVSEYITENPECRAKVQLCVVTYGENTEVVKGFGPVENIKYDLAVSGGEPDLCAALKRCVELINDQIRVYKSESISHYLPELLLLSSGKSTTDTTEIAKRLCIAQLSNRLCVLPFKIADNSSEILETLTDDNTVYTELINFEKIFQCLKSGLELLSVSSAAACANLKSQAVGWNQFIKKG